MTGEVSMVVRGVSAVYGCVAWRRIHHACSPALTDLMRFMSSGKRNTLGG